ncbi:MAG: Rpp14/Pop5 family protein [Candidatus Methanoperedens sp.]|nr:Rpp14/Pop5 family protein [Candidatus Methanoperedens sp.]
MKTLPVLRDKKRYIAFEVTPGQQIKRRNLEKEIFDSAGSLFGDTGLSEMNPRLISYNGRYGIIRCNRALTEETRAALACINISGGIRLSLHVLGISGTIKGATEKFIQKMLIKEPESGNK